MLMLIIDRRKEIKKKKERRRKRKYKNCSFANKNILIVKKATKKYENDTVTLI